MEVDRVGFSLLSFLRLSFLTSEPASHGQDPPTVSEWMYLLCPGSGQVDGASLAVAILTTREQVIHVPVSICERSTESTSSPRTRAPGAGHALACPPGTPSKRAEPIKVVPLTLHGPGSMSLGLLPVLTAHLSGLNIYPKLGKRPHFRV